MKFTTDKCKVMNIGANNLEEKYFMEVKKLKKVKDEIDVGVMISSNFKV